MTLVVRLYYSGAFSRRDIWKSTAEFADEAGRICGFFFEGTPDGSGTLSIFFETDTSSDSKILFMKFVHRHLLRRAIGGTVRRERIYRCPNAGCNKEVKVRDAIEGRLRLGKATIRCQYCDEPVELIDILETKFGDPHLKSRVTQMETEVENLKTSAIGTTTSMAKGSMSEFDVFLAHNSQDKDAVDELHGLLTRHGISPWLDVEQIPPGRWFQDVIQQAIPNVKSAAIIIGKRGLGRWQALELRAFITQCIERKIPVIPVLLPTVDQFPEGFLFLMEPNTVRFREDLTEQAPINSSLWRITGERPSKSSRY